MNEQITTELRSAKRWIAVGALALLASTISMVGISVWSYSAVNEYEENTCEQPPWDDQAYDAIDEANYEKSLSLANERLETHPNDADAFYIKAQIAFYQGDSDQAKKYLLHTKALAPSWTEEYINPLMEAIEENAFNKAFQGTG